MNESNDQVSLNTAHELAIAGRKMHELVDEVTELYRSTDSPWVIGYSGGKDSTAILRLVYESLLLMPRESRHKPVFVVSSDTLVETPVVVDLISQTLLRVQAAALQHELPIHTAQVTPDSKQTFWVNLIGRGYPAPTKSFRWCTERMKIDPVSEFILDKVQKYGEVVCVLGSRISESSSRAQVMRRHRITGSRLARHTTLPNAYVYTPIEDWSADNVWEYLFSHPAPWGDDHASLMKLYKDSNAGECPLVIDTSTPSCGNSRFGCWVCTVVTKDKSMDNLIDAGERWLVPLQDIRNELYRSTLPENKKGVRNLRRRTGKITAVMRNGKPEHIPGPYLLSYRKALLRRVLAAEQTVQSTNPEVSLIKEDEIHEIRNLWMNDPNEPDWEDSAATIYKEVTGKDLTEPESDAGAFTKLDADLLHELRARHDVPPALVMKLIELEVSMDGLSKRSQIFDRISQILHQDWGSEAAALSEFEKQHHREAALDETEKQLVSLYAALEALKSDAA